MRSTLDINAAAQDFLAQKRIAVVGVSRNKRDFSRAIVRKLSTDNREVILINPAAAEIDGVRCFPNLRSVEGGPVGALLVLTPPSTAAGVVRECAALGIPRVWLHRSVGPGSASEEAVKIAADSGIMLIRAGCPMMFCEPVDIAHKCVRWCLRVTGRLPKTVAGPSTAGV